MRRLRLTGDRSDDGRSTPGRGNRPYTGSSLDVVRTNHLTGGLLRDPDIGPVSGPTTFSLAIRLEDEPYAIRVGFANDIGIDYLVSAVSACLADSYGDGFNPPGGTWRPVETGSHGRNIGDDLAPARSQARSLFVPGNGGGPRVPNVAWTEWSLVGPLPSSETSTRPVLFLRASMPAWSLPRCCNTVFGFSGTAAAHGRDIVSGMLQGNDAATDPDWEPYFGQWESSPFYCVQYRSRRRGATVLWGGDSHFAGDRTTGLINSFALQSCLALSTPELPVSAANYAWGGSPSLVFMPLLHRMMEACRPQVVVLQGWTANDGPSEAAAVAYADQIISTAQRARQLGAVPILVTRFCRSTLAARDSERMVADRLRQAQLSAASAEMPVIDATAVLEDPAHPGAFRPGLSQDGIHPNDAGHAAVAALLTPVLRGLLAEAALSLVEHRPSFTGSDQMFNKLRMSLGLTPIAPAHAIAPAGDYEVRGRRCIGAITDECNPTRVPMTIQVETSGRSLLQEMQAPYDPNHRDYRFALELDSRVTPRDLLAEQVLLYARNAFGLRAKLALDGASQLTLIREHLGKPRDVLFDLDLTQGGNGVAFMREGWCGPEPQVCCTDGPRAVLEVPVAIAPDQRYELTIACFPFLDPAVLDQRMIVTINGFPQQAVMDHKMLEFLSFVFPTNSVAGGDTTTIEFEFPDCYAPADLDRNEDRRRLSFGFKQLVLARLLPLTLEG